jgi:hypothetical protein
MGQATYSYGGAMNYGAGYLFLLFLGEGAEAAFLSFHDIEGAVPRGRPERSEILRSGGLSIIPRQPAAGMGGHRLWVARRRQQVLERDGPAAPTGVNQAHKDVPHLRAVDRFITHGVVNYGAGYLFLR